ncbi:multiple monosaccharide ABC transporter substrate-binding protein [Catenuloplanes atrovinosus]|uniref:Multiple sugar transport system substrate-binding protein n=1 Tax=Catenuloplanes atrovinosus TaxID=137266 RepID=A0AAE3YPG5_9ACTN|nr:multiple monosaccharide ABC transporter substrate-binding protein [Catenuloplanes atrovinosus]MDR7276235.1 putative multiple sugar transport system substrate-binding protein [Catenuloplanes atrovinosus]
MIRRWAASVALAVALTGCGGDTAEVGAPDRGMIGIAMPTKESQRWIGDGENMVAQFSLLGYRTSLQYADDDNALQVSQIQQMLDDGAKALVIGAIDGTKLKDVLAAAAAAQVPVISYDRLIRGTNDIDYYATFDNFKVGVLQADYIVDALRLARGGGPYNIELFAGSADDNNATFFFNGAMSVLQPYINDGTLDVVSGETSFEAVATQRWDGKVAKERMARLLGSTYTGGRRVDAVLSPYDGISRGIIEALRESGYAENALPVLTGQDAELDSVKLIAAGQQGQTVYKDTRELAKVAVQMVNSLVGDAGEPVVNDTTQYNNGVKDVRTFLLQPVSVTKANYQRVLVEGGYYTAAEISG